MKTKPCNHLDAIDQILGPKVLECEECVKIGSTWKHLRTCQTCGKTLCCDSSPMHHAHNHAIAARHPVIISAEPEEYWMYCYVDDIMETYS